MVNILIAVLLDFIIGDPYIFPHPVKLMGKIIELEERASRSLFKSAKGLKIAGLFIVIVNISLAYIGIFLLLEILKANSIIYRIFSIYLIYASIAARSLHYEAKMVLKALEEGLEQGRKRLSYIVGRDTSNLTEEEVIKATIETVGENTSDGVIGPLFYIALLGAPGGIAYKFINTMDSMLGYKNEKYENLGFFPAKTDDLFNLIPARVTGILMNITSIGRFDTVNGFRILRRDCRNHKSPNSGYPESAVAGLLGIKLGGGSIYHGKYVEKPTIGETLNNISKKQIMDTVEIMYRTEIGFLIICVVTKILLNPYFS